MSRFLGAEQLRPDVPKGRFEAWANAEDGAPLGRELELAGLLAFIKSNGIRNVVWLTVDVHYASATFYNPARAKFTDSHPSLRSEEKGAAERAPLRFRRAGSEGRSALEAAWPVAP
jgi:phosphodiesterase/alkaline phosphatase D-like protein